MPSRRATERAPVRKQAAGVPRHGRISDSASIGGHAEERRWDAFADQAEVD